MGNFVNDRVVGNMPLARATGTLQKFERAIAGTPDAILTGLILVAAGVIVFLAFRLPPGAKPALLAYVILP